MLTTIKLRCKSSGAILTHSLNAGQKERFDASVIFLWILRKIIPFSWAQLAMIVPSPMSQTHIWWLVGDGLTQLFWVQL